MVEECCKIGKVAKKYELPVEHIHGDVNEYLVARWLGRGDYSAIGVRKLADWFNKKLLREVYIDNGRSAIEPRIDNEYEVLTGDDEIQREEVIDDLRADGIDGAELVRDFVSRSTMRRHLNGCLEAEKNVQPSSTGSGSSWEEDKIEFARKNFQQHVEESLQSLENKNELLGGTDAVIKTPIVLSCPECATQVRFSTALDRGYTCEAHTETDSSPTPEQTELVRALREFTA